MHRYATTKELGKRSFKLNNQNMKQKFDIQVTFILEIQPQKHRFLGKSDFFLETCVFILNPCKNGNVHKYGTT